MSMFMAALLALYAGASTPAREGSSVRVKLPTPEETKMMRGWLDFWRRGMKASVRQAAPVTFVENIRVKRSRVDASAGKA